MEKTKTIKTKDNILQIMLVSIMIAMITFSGNLSFAASSYLVESEGTSENLLVYKKEVNKRFVNINIKTTYAAAKAGGISYPAYCLNLERPGVEEDHSYKVNVNGIVKNKMIYRAIINGHPYKSLSELGVKTKEEAYTATKQAVYTILYNRNVKDYSAANSDAGRRTYSAYLKIVKAGREGKEVYNPGFLKMESLGEWKTHNDRIIKKFILKSNKDGKATLSINSKLDDLKVLDKSKKEISLDKVSLNSELYISTNISNLKELESGNIEINASSKLITNPVFYTMPKDQSYQNYAISGFKTSGDVLSKLSLKLSNDTSVKIKKIDKDTKKTLKDVTFRISNKDGEVVGFYTTDSSGNIVIDNFIPGEYTLKEISTPEGYVKSKEDIKFLVKYNEVKSLVVENEKLKIRILPKTGC